MIPVNLESYSVIDFKKESVRTKKDKKYLELLKNQLAWLNANSVQVKEKASKLYYMYVNNKLKQSIKNRCCNFLLLEEKCITYNVEGNKEYVIN